MPVSQAAPGALPPANQVAGGDDAIAMQAALNQQAPGATARAEEPAVGPRKVVPPTEPTSTAYDTVSPANTFSKPEPTFNQYLEQNGLMGKTVSKAQAAAYDRDFKENVLAPWCAEKSEWDKTEASRVGVDKANAGALEVQRRAAAADLQRQNEKIEADRVAADNARTTADRAEAIKNATIPHPTVADAKAIREELTTAEGTMPDGTAKSSPVDTALSDLVNPDTGKPFGNAATARASLSPRLQSVFLDVATHIKHANPDLSADTVASVAKEFLTVDSADHDKVSFSTAMTGPDGKVAKDKDGNTIPEFDAAKNPIFTMADGMKIRLSRDALSVIDAGRKHFGDYVDVAAKKAEAKLAADAQKNRDAARSDAEKRSLRRPLDKNIVPSKPDLDRPDGERSCRRSAAMPRRHRVSTSALACSIEASLPRSGADVSGATPQAPKVARPAVGPATPRTSPATEPDLSEQKRRLKELEVQ